MSVVAIQATPAPGAARVDVAGAGDQHREHDRRHRAVLGARGQEERLAQADRRWANGSGRRGVAALARMGFRPGYTYSMIPAAEVRTISVPCSTMRARWRSAVRTEMRPRYATCAAVIATSVSNSTSQNQLFELIEVHELPIKSSTTDGEATAAFARRTCEMSDPRNSPVKAAISTRKKRAKRAGARAQGPINAALTTFPPALAVKSLLSWLSGMPSATPSVRAAATCVCAAGMSPPLATERRSPSRCPTRRRRRFDAAVTPPMTPGAMFLPIITMTV